MHVYSTNAKAQICVMKNGFAHKIFHMRLLSKVSGGTTHLALLTLFSQLLVSRTSLVLGHSSTVGNVSSFFTIHSTGAARGT